jgi:hypothetical protein
MATKYQLRVGMWDVDLDQPVEIGTPAWTAYLAWLALGNVADVALPAPPPALTPEQLAAKAELEALATIKQALRAHPMVQQLLVRSPADVDSWLLANVTSLPTAMPVLRVLCYVVAFLARERLR